MKKENSEYKQNVRKLYNSNLENSFPYLAQKASPYETRVFHIISPFFPRNATNEKEDKLFQETNKNITILKKNNNYNKLALFRELNFLLELYALNTKKKFIYMLSCSRLRKTKR